MIELDPDVVVPIAILFAAIASIWVIRKSMRPTRKRVGFLTRLFRRATDDDDLALARNSNEFYQSHRWKTVRYKAIVLNMKKYKKLSKGEIKYGMCVSCHHAFSRTDSKHGDHIKPRSKYPELALILSNIQILCAICNPGKGAHDETNWRDIGQRPKRRWFWQRAA